MNEIKTQNYASHRRYDPAYHYVLAALLVGLMVLALIDAVKLHNLSSVAHLGLLVALLIMAFKLRAYPLAAQDRLIRLEEQLRAKTLLPKALAERAMQLTASQWVALRFASDEELPGLVQAILDNDLQNEAIKKMIKTWRQDQFRV